MVLEFNEQDLVVIRKGLEELPIKIALETLIKFDKQVTDYASQLNQNINPDKIESGG